MFSLRWVYVFSYMSVDSYLCCVQHSVLFVVFADCTLINCKRAIAFRFRRSRRNWFSALQFESEKIIILKSPPPAPAYMCGRFGVQVYTQRYILNLYETQFNLNNNWKTILFPRSLCFSPFLFWWMYNLRWTCLSKPTAATIDTMWKIGKRQHRKAKERKKRNNRKIQCTYNYKNKRYKTNEIKIEVKLFND